MLWIALSFIPVKLTQMRRLQLRQFNAGFFEIGVNIIFNAVAIAAVRDRINLSFYIGQPCEHIVAKENVRGNLTDCRELCILLCFRFFTRKIPVLIVGCAEFLQLFLRCALVAFLYSNSCGNPF